MVGGGGRGGRAARDGRRRGGGVRARPPGRVGARLGGRERGAAHPDRDLAGQALPGGARPPRGRRLATPRYASAAACRSTRTSRPASSPGCSSTSRRCSERSRRARCGSAPSTRGSATCSGPASPPIPPRRRAPSSRRRARRTGIRGCSTLFGVPRDALPAIRDSVGDLGVLRHPDWDRELPLRAQVVDQQAALAGAGCVEPGRVKATYGTGVFVLAHAGTERPDPLGGRAAADGGVACGRAGGVRPRRRGVHRGRAARMAEPRPRARGGPAGPRRARLRGGGQRRGAGAAGARRPRCTVVAAGCHRGRSPGSPARARAGHVARAALESIAWRVADILAVVSEHAEPETLRVDGGLTRDPLLLQLQADVTGVPVEPGAIDATAAGAAALAAVGAGVWTSTREIGERVPTGRTDRARARRRVAQPGSRRLARVRRARGGALTARKGV